MSTKVVQDPKEAAELHACPPWICMQRSIAKRITTTTMDIITEPAGDSYSRLLDLATRRCERFSLVWRPGAQCDEAVEIALAPYLLDESRAFEWPGTVLHGGPPATLRTYQLNPDSAQNLKAAGSLYAWQHPERPEDLAFYKADGQLWLGSIAHEGDAWLAPDAMTLDEIAALPLHVRAPRDA